MITRSRKETMESIARRAEREELPIDLLLEGVAPEVFGNGHRCFFCGSILADASTDPCVMWQGEDKGATRIYLHAACARTIAIHLRADASVALEGDDSVAVLAELWQLKLGANPDPRKKSDVIAGAALRMKSVTDAKLRCALIDSLARITQVDTRLVDAEVRRSNMRFPHIDR